MYEQFFGFREKPFSLTPDPEFLFLSKKHRTALSMLEYGVANRTSITVVTGEIGSGKTTLIRKLLNEVNDDVTIGLITNTHRAFGNLLQWICLAYGLPHEGRTETALYQAFVDFLIAEYAKTRRTVLIVDEAQNMDQSALEELRVLSNINADKDLVLQLILVGQPELRETLMYPGLRQLVQRVGVAYHLKPLDLAETGQYIKHRLRVASGNENVFTTPAIIAVHQQTSGVPRLINKLCDMALVYGFAGQVKEIGPDLVNEVVREQAESGIALHGGFDPAKTRLGDFKE